MAHGHRHVDAYGVVEAVGDGSRIPKGVNVGVSYKQGDVVVRGVQFAFSSQGQNLVKYWSMRSRVSIQQVGWRGRRATEGEKVDRCGACRFRLLFSLPIRKRVALERRSRVLSSNHRSWVRKGGAVGARDAGCVVGRR